MLNNKRNNMNRDIIAMNELFDSFTPEQEAYALENEFPYVYSKASSFLVMGAEKYRANDFFKQPPLDFDEEDISILQHGCSLVLSGVGMSVENPFTGLDVAGFSALMRMFHFEAIGRKTKHGKVLNNEKGALDCIKFKHMVDGRTCEYFNFCRYPKMD
jgi:hypothetical protein